MWSVYTTLKGLTEKKLLSFLFKNDDFEPILFLFFFFAFEEGRGCLHALDLSPGSAPDKAPATLWEFKMRQIACSKKSSACGFKHNQKNIWHCIEKYSCTRAFFRPSIGYTTFEYEYLASTRGFEYKYEYFKIGTRVALLTVPYLRTVPQHTAILASNICIILL